MEKITITVNNVNYTVIPNIKGNGVIITDSKTNKFLLKETFPKNDLDIKFLENAIYKFMNY